MSLLVRPGQVEKKPAFIALIHVVTTGQKQMRWYQIDRFFLVSNVEIWTFMLEIWGRERGLYDASRSCILVLLAKVAQGSVD